MNRTLRYALAGLQCGITGALAMLVWIAAASVWHHRSIWWVPNLVASVHYGQGSVRTDAGVYTVAGAAMVFFFYGAVGILFGLMIRESPASFRLFCFGVIVSLAVYWILERWFWRAANPVGNLYAPDGQMLFAHLIFGCFLARYPATARIMPSGMRVDL